MIGIADFVVRASGLVTLPILTRMLLPSEYGLWALIIVTITIVSSFFQGGLGVSLVRFIPSEKDWVERAEAISSTLVLVLGMGLIGTILLWAFVSVEGGRFLRTSENETLFFQWSSLLVPLYALRDIVTRALRALRCMQHFAAVNFFKTFLEIGGLLFLRHVGGKVLQVIMLYVVIETLTVAIGFWLLNWEIPLKAPTFKTARRYFLFGIPLSANALILLIIHSSDRYLLSYFLGLSAAGIYSVASNISMMTLLFLMPIQSVLLIATADLYDAHQMAEVRKYFHYSLKYYLILTLPILVGLTLYGGPFVKMLATESYLGESWVLPCLALGHLLYGFYQLLIFATYLRQRTYVDFFLLVGGAVANIGLNLILIPFFRIPGAAVATVLSFFLLAAAAYGLAMRSLGILCDAWIGCKALLATGVMTFVIVSVSERKTVFDLGPIFLGLLAYFGTLLLLRTFRVSEFRLLTAFSTPESS